MPLDFSRARPLLQKCDLPKLFIEELGWEPARQKLTLCAGETDYAFTAVAKKSGFTAWLCESPGGGLPDHATRLKLDRKLSETSFEHLIVFVTGDHASQSWMWVRREQGKPLAARTHEYQSGQPGNSLLQKLQILYVSLDEEEAGLSTVAVAGRARAAFDIERVTKAFYRDFDTHRKAFLKFIDGISEVADCEWYASVMLNRLMFVYFIQRKGFLDGDSDYLRHRLDRCKKEQGKDQFYTFYRYFLLRLFHEGFGKRRQDRATDLEKLLGNIPYLNGGLFDVHELEKPERYGKDIAIPDKAFERIFDYFDQYQWHLDERPLRADNEINPDVLGYIFEKYINQKQMGAYYTKEDITEYISKNTVIPFLFDAARAKCKVAFENPGGSTIWDLLHQNPDRYIYPAVRHGVSWDIHAKKPLEKPLPLPPEIAAGLDATKPNLIERRQPWNKPALANYALPTEIWREVVARRQRCEEVRRKLAAGEVREVNDFITLNLDLRQFAQDVILNSEGPDLLRAVWSAIQKVTVLDPTCGSGAFLFAALNILEPLYEICIDRMEAFVADDDRDRPKAPEETARELIVSGESQTLEFKATARWNLRESKADKAMEQMIVKTVAAFLNSDGGNLLIGVQDDGTISGIEPDHQVVSTDKQSRDFYERWLTTLLLGQCGKEHTANLRISFVRLEEMDVCRIDVSRASTTVYVKENDQEKFYVRTGNSTNALTTSEVVAYLQQRSTNSTAHPKTVDRSKPSSPKKYADFRKVIEMVSAHPKRSYFIYKSIILNNLFGVDIMEEAVEICKLRLFLKLAAQVEPDGARENLGIEPLPDIDFNIRAGNTLVGYATYDEVKRAITSGLDFDNAMEKIAVKAADLQQIFDKFRQLQTEGDGSVPAAHKLELQKRLKAQEDELNRHLAGEYGVKVSDKAAYAQWVKSHQPFHWFIQFYGILNGGGFDVIVGNPPYVEYSKVRKLYSLQKAYEDYSTNLYASCCFRAENLKCPAGYASFIVPVSFPSTDRMQPLRELLLAKHNVFHVSFSTRPSKLFEEAEQRLTIYIQTPSAAKPRLISGGFLKWYSEERAALFSLLEFVEVAPMKGRNSIWPKIRGSLEKAVFSKITGMPTLAGSGALVGGEVLYYKNTGIRYFNTVTLRPPKCWINGKATSSSRETHLSASRETKSAVHATLLSTTFFCYFQFTSNCRDLNPSDIRLFCTPKSLFGDTQLAKLSPSIEKDYVSNAKTITMQNKLTGTVELESLSPAKSKPILDEIDTVLAGHYGFTAEELDFILNYDIKYRLGRATEGEEE